MKKYKKEMGVLEMKKKKYLLTIEYRGEDKTFSYYSKKMRLISMHGLRTHFNIKKFKLSDKGDKNGPNIILDF